jgi:hypothetical protein
MRMGAPEVSEGRIWENGSPGRNTAEVQLVCGTNGEKLAPVWADGCGAGFRPEPGMHVIQVERPGGGQEPRAAVYRYEGGERFTLVVEGTYMDVEVPEYLEEPLKAAGSEDGGKAYCYHCSCLHWALKPQGRR